jgi:hypothetical protein
LDIVSSGDFMRLFAYFAIAYVGLVAGAHAKCEAMAKAPWTSAKQFKFTLEAHAVGPSCADGAVVLLVIDDKGIVQWSTTRLSHQNAMFQEGVTDNASMTTALAGWLAQGLETKPQVAKDLPYWKLGKDQAEREGDGEFGFFASPDVTRDFYISVRDENQPVFCFVQGIESTSCIEAAGPQNIYELGGFTFPG